MGAAVFFQFDDSCDGLTVSSERCWDFYDCSDGVISSSGC